MFTRPAATTPRIALSAVPLVETKTMRREPDSTASDGGFETIIDQGGCLPEVGIPYRVIADRPKPLLKDAGASMLTALKSSMKKEHRIVIGSSYQVSSGSTGVTTQLVSADLLAGINDFLNVSNLFGEFFLQGFEVMYTPSSRYSKPAVSTDLPNDVPLVVVDLQHGQSTYTSHTLACGNANLIVCGTADPWKAKWRNTEKRSSGVAPSPLSTTVLPTQGWCPVDNASSYTGALQIISPAALPNPAFNFLYGTVVVRWDVYFRSRR